MRTLARLSGQGRWKSKQTLDYEGLINTCNPSPAHKVDLPPPSNAVQRSQIMYIEQPKRALRIDLSLAIPLVSPPLFLVTESHLHLTEFFIVC